MRRSSLSSAFSRVHHHGLGRVGGLGRRSGRRLTEAIEVARQPLRVGDNGLDVVKTGLAALHRLADLNGGPIELELDLQFLDPVYLRQQLEAVIPYMDTPATLAKPLFWQSPDDWTAGLKASEEAGVIKAGYQPEEYFTNQFVPTTK